MHPDRSHGDLNLGHADSEAGSDEDGGHSLQHRSIDSICDHEPVSEGRGDSLASTSDDEYVDGGDRRGRGAEADDGAYSSGEGSSVDDMDVPMGIHAVWAVYDASYAKAYDALECFQPTSAASLLAPGSGGSGAGPYSLWFPVGRFPLIRAALGVDGPADLVMDDVLCRQSLPSHIRRPGTLSVCGPVRSLRHRLQRSSIPTELCHGGTAAMCFVAEPSSDTPVSTGTDPEYVAVEQCCAAVFGEDTHGRRVQRRPSTARSGSRSRSSRGRQRDDGEMAEGAITTLCRQLFALRGSDASIVGFEVTLSAVGYECGAVRSPIQRSRRPSMQHPADSMVDLLAPPSRDAQPADLRVRRSSTGRVVVANAVAVRIASDSDVASLSAVLKPRVESFLAEGVQQQEPGRVALVSVDVAVARRHNTSPDRSITAKPPQYPENGQLTLVLCPGASATSDYEPLLCMPGSAAAEVMTAWSAATSSAKAQRLTRSTSSVRQFLSDTVHPDSHCVMVVVL